MARKSPPPTNQDAPRPNRIAVHVTDEVLARLDAWRAPGRRKRADAAALLIERALDSSTTKAG